MRLLRPVPALLVLVLIFSSAADGQEPAVTLTPEVVQPGSPELVRVVAADATAVEGEWLGRKLEFFRSRDGRAWFALAGVDVEAPVGPSTLHISVREADGAHDVTRAVEIHPSHYRSTALSVPPRFVEPSPEQLKRIEAEIQLKREIFATSADTPLWRGSFRAPVQAPPTDSFGTRRVFNGKLASIHKGMDFRARTGTPVRAEQQRRGGAGPPPLL